MNYHILFVIIISGMGLVSCDNSFSPKGDIQESPVIYCVLNGSEEIQFIRVSRMYNPPGVNPLDYTGEKSVDIQSVIISDGYSDFRCTDTTLLQVGGRTEKAFYIKNLKVYHDWKYSIKIETKDFGQLRAQLQMPPAPGLVLNGATTYLILDTTKGLTAFAWEAAASDNHPFGTYFRLWIMSLHDNPGGGIDTIRDEVPLERQIIEGVVKDVNPVPSRDLQQTYSYPILLEKFREVKKRGDRFTMQLKCTGYCFEKNFYTYYKLIHGFDDPFSMRTDTPDFTNIENGRGVFGGMTVDSITIGFPASLIEHL